MKKLLISALAIIITLFCCLSVCAAEEKNLLIDQANLLTESEISTITSQLKDLQTKYDVDVVILTVETVGGESMRDYADDYYDYNGYSPNGMLFLIAMEEREMYISTAGTCIDAFTDDDIERVFDAIWDDVRDGEYASAFQNFVTECDCELEYYVNGEPFELGTTIIIALVVGFIIAFIVVSVMKGKLKTVAFQKSANNYAKMETLKLTNSNELFLYRNVSRVLKPQNNNNNSSSTHRSSSGRSHGGGGRSF